MRRISRFKAFLAALLIGGIVPSCGTDFRDAALTGVLDAVSGTVTDSITTAVPVPDWIAAWLGRA
jgi:hypothetical protein